MINISKIILSVSLFIIMIIASSDLSGAEWIRDHEVVLDEKGRLMPWTTYDNIILWSMNFIKKCPLTKTKFGDDPWFLVTAKYNEDGTLLLKQNNPGSNVYWGVETLKKYYAYTGDETHSPLPFRVNLKTGEVLDPYCSNMILVINLFDELIHLDIPIMSNLNQQNPMETARYLLRHSQMEKNIHLQTGATGLTVVSQVF